MRFAARVYVCISISCALAACGSEPERETGADDETATGTGTDESGTETSDQDTTDPDTTSQESGDASMEDETGGGSSCGNGNVEPGEACDGDDLAGQTCMELGFVGGELSCTDACAIDATGCTNQVCGNGTLEAPEECDGLDFGGVNCTDLGFGPGLPLCTGRCTIDTSTCPTLGEGEMCGGFNQCLEDLHCVSNVCYDGSPGDPCNSGFDCQSMNCEGATLFEDGTCA